VFSLNRPSHLTPSRVLRLAALKHFLHFVPTTLSFHSFKQFSVSLRLLMSSTFKHASVALQTLTHFMSSNNIIHFTPFIHEILMSSTFKHARVRDTPTRCRSHTSLRSDSHSLRSLYTHELRSFRHAHSLRSFQLDHCVHSDNHSLRSLIRCAHPRGAQLLTHHNCSYLSKISCFKLVIKIYSLKLY
jgi:hypothetical protein